MKEQEDFKDYSEYVEYMREQRKIRDARRCKLVNKLTITTQILTGLIGFAIGIIVIFK